MGKKKANKKAAAREPKARKNGKGSVSMKVTLGTLSIGKDTAAIGFSFDRKAVSLGRADQILVGSRLKVELGSEDPGQEHLFDDNELIAPVESIADIHSLSLKQSTLSGRLSFRRKELGDDMQRLMKLANSDGHLTATKIGQAGKETEEPEAEETT